MRNGGDDDARQGETAERQINDVTGRNWGKARETVSSVPERGARNSSDVYELAIKNYGVVSKKGIFNANNGVHIFTKPLLNGLQSYHTLKHRDPSLECSPLAPR
jgi:hypothetical protein